MRSALQIQTELDAVGKIRFQGGQGLWQIGNSNQPDKTNKNDGGDENCLPLEIGTHGLGWLRTRLEFILNLALLLLLAFRLESGHCGTQYFHFHLIGDAKLYGIALEAYDCAE